MPWLPHHRRSSSNSSSTTTTTTASRRDSSSCSRGSNPPLRLVWCIAIFALVVAVVAMPAAMEKKSGGDAALLAPLLGRDVNSNNNSDNHNYGAEKGAVINTVPTTVATAGRDVKTKLISLAGLCTVLVWACGMLKETAEVSGVEVKKEVQWQTEGWFPSRKYSDLLSLLESRKKNQ